MRIKAIISVVLLVLLAFSCREKQKEKEVAEKVVVSDFDIIQKQGELLLLTENSSTSYFLYKGTPIGFDYELVKAFCKDHDLELRVKVIEDLNLMFENLEDRQGDLIACNLAVTSDRKERVDFTEPLLTTRQVLVQRKPDEWWNLSKSALKDSLLIDPVQLEGKTIGVHAYSSFYKRLVNLQEELGININIKEMSGTIDSEELIKMVAEGELDYTIADENVAMLNATYYSNIDVGLQISMPQRIAWAVRKGSDSLLVALNDWMTAKENQRKIAHIKDKYFAFKKTHKSKVTSEFSSLSGKKISRYDEFIKEQAEIIGWDWTMLAALIKKESNFNPEAISWAGAYGLMQLMPETAIHLGGDTTDTEYDNIRTGVKYLQRVQKYWSQRIDDPDECVKFVLASYNAGIGHVKDAQVLAGMDGGDSLKWSNSVENGMLLKSKKEYYRLDGVRHGYCRGDYVVNYVDDILSYYEHFKTLQNEG